MNFDTDGLKQVVLKQNKIRKLFEDQSRQILHLKDAEMQQNTARYQMANNQATNLFNQYTKLSWSSFLDAEKQQKQAEKIAKTIYEDTAVMIDVIYQTQMTELNLAFYEKTTKMEECFQKQLQTPAHPSSERFKPKLMFTPSHPPVSPIPENIYSDDEDDNFDADIYEYVNRPKT